MKRAHDCITTAEPYPGVVGEEDLDAEWKDLLSHLFAVLVHVLVADGDHVQLKQAKNKSGKAEHHCRANL
jgi:hypothetical protein